MSAILAALLHAVSYITIAWVLLIVIANVYLWYENPEIAVFEVEGMTLCGRIYWICCAMPAVLVASSLPYECGGWFMYGLFSFTSIVCNPIKGCKDLWVELKDMYRLETETCCEKGIIMTRQGRNGNWSEWQEVCASTDVEKLEEYLKKVEPKRSL